MWHYVRPTDQYIIPTRNVIDAHAQEFVVNNELLLPILKAFAGALAGHTLLEIFDIFQPFSIRREVCRTFRHQSIWAPTARSPPTAPDTPKPRGNHSLICGL